MYSRQHKRLIYIYFSIFLGTTHIVSSQSSLVTHFRNNSYEINLDGGDFSQMEFLIPSLDSFDFFISGELHGVISNYKIRIRLLKFFHKNAGARYYVIEMGKSRAYLLNQFLLTGDEKFILPSHILEEPFWHELYEYNATLDVKEKLIVLGVDFERVESFIKVMKLLLPNKAAPQGIQKGIKYIMEIIAKKIAGGERVKLARKIRQDLEENESIYQEYFGMDFTAFKDIIMNDVPITSKTSRDKHMVKNLVNYYRQVPKGKYYAQFGMSHVNLSLGHFAAQLNDNTSSPINNKVLTILPHYFDSESFNAGEHICFEDTGILAVESIKHDDRAQIKNSIKGGAVFWNLMNLKASKSLARAAHLVVIFKDQAPYNSISTCNFLN